MPETETEVLPLDADGPLQTEPSDKFDDVRKQALARLVDGWIEEAERVRRPNAARYLEGYRFYRGDQNGEIDVKTLEWRETIKNRSGGRHYRVSNKIRGYVRKHHTRALSASLYTVAVPLQQNNKVDVAAAEQANACLSHSHRILRRKQMLAKAQKRAIAGGPQFFHHYFEKDAIVPVVEIDETGQTKAIHDVRAGEIKCELVKFSEMLIDPTADGWEDARWVAYQKARPLSYIRTRWEAARNMVLGSGDKSQAESDQDSDNVASGRGDDGNHSDKMATVDTILVKPHGWEDKDGTVYGFPRGLYLVKVGEKVLEVSDWPYTHLVDERGEVMFPFEPIMFEESLDGFWGDNAVTPLVPLQRTRNQMVSALDAHAKSGDGKIFVEAGVLLKPDGFKNGANNEVNEYKRKPGDGSGFPVQFFPTPPINASVMASIVQIDRDMDEIAEVNDVSRGQAPFSGASGRTVVALQGADQEAGLPFQQLTETCVYNCDLIFLGLAKQFYKERRLITLQDRTDKDAPPQAMAQAFDELSQGRFALTVRSQVPQSLAAKMEMYGKLLGANAFAKENLEATLPLLKALNLDDGDKQTADWVSVIEAQIARDNEAEDKAAQLEQQMREMEQRHEAEKLAAETDAKIQIEAAKADFEMKMAAFERKLDLLMPKPQPETEGRQARK